MSEMLSSEQLYKGGCFLGPVAAALLLLASHEAPSVDAESDYAIDAEFVAEDMRLPHIAPRGALAGERAEEYRDEAWGLMELGVAASPFASNARYEHEPEVVDGGPEYESPAMKLTSVMSTGEGAICVINQQVRRAGDPVGAVWRVVSIDVGARSVTLERADGRTLVLAQR